MGPHHPIAVRLDQLGDLHLVGSRSFGTVFVDGRHCELWNKESDWDYYLGAKLTKDGYQTSLRPCWTALEAMGFTRLDGEGGPYGRDQLIEGVWRLAAGEAFGVAYPHVDVILGTVEEIAYRMKVWSRIVQSGSPLPRALKAERAWGAFWWVHRVGQ